MRLVADESCDFGLVRVLRSAGHDVTSIAETRAGIDDEQVIELALCGPRARTNSPQSVDLKKGLALGGMHVARD